ncbi:hypothetical protein A2264_01880 [candidate division WWE3 bacterium RIFOXYA2_FULL_46_9]|uniref:Uncharacterized protein n=1 Tax=candidate division WWE3 bacterium RIFOXYA2_FULL_46_9 TaxID=1802636 RepID=A0A1F4W151_UNCKA|nr:MAG: hypothetical protein A2264_01880 [candidate division WWE3 bacterium RIFOXYA2_FULL_46_9]
MSGRHHKKRTSRARSAFAKAKSGVVDSRLMYTDEYYLSAECEAGLRQGQHGRLGKLERAFHVLRTETPRTLVTGERTRGRSRNPRRSERTNGAEEEL